MASLATVLPTLLLAAGALLALRAPERFRPRRADVVLLASVLAVAASLGLAALAWPTAGRQAPRLVLPAWGGEVFADELAAHTDLLAAACILLVAGLAVVAVLRTPTDDADRLGGPLAVAAASALFITMAGTPVGLVMSWLALDAAIWRGAGGTGAGVLAGQVGLLAALAGLSGLEGGTAFLGAAGAAEISEVGIFLLVVAGMARMGLYPLWWTVPHADRRPPQLALLTRLAPTVAGAYLALRVSDLIPPGAGLDTVALAAPVIAIGFGALLGWLGTERDRLEVLGWQTTAHAGLVLMAARLGGPVGQAIAVLLVLDLVLGRAVLFAAERPAGPPDAWARRLATASLAGLPPTLGFGARWLLFRELLAAHLYAVLVVTVAASALLVPPAATPTAAPDAGAPPGDGWRSRAAAAVLLGLAGLEVFLGLGFDAFRGTLVALTTTDQPSPLTDMIGSIQSPLTRVTGLLLLAAVLAPPFAGAALQGARRRAAAGEVRGGVSGAGAAGGAAGWRHRRALRLTGLLRGAANGLIGTGRLLHAATGLVEGRRVMSWTLLAAATVGTMMLASAARPIAPPPAPTLVAGLFLVAAWLAAGTMLLVRAPLATLGALAGGYATAALVLGLAGHPEAATVQGMAGLIVLGILWISVAQRGARPEAGGSAGRLAALRASGAPPAERLMPSLALAMGLAIGYGMQLSALPEPQAVPVDVLRPALALCAGGVLTVVFARTPLRLAGGVLLALTGFELVYARLDDGLLITGGLAAFQLLFAIVASHFVGTGPASRPDAAPEA